MVFEILSQLRLNGTALIAGDQLAAHQQLERLRDFQLVDGGERDLPDGPNHRPSGFGEALGHTPAQALESM